MEDKLKYRLVGATVILALMAFFLPLILDSKKYKTEIVSQIPPMPVAVNANPENTTDASEQEISPDSSLSEEEGTLVIDLEKGLEEQSHNSPKANLQDESISKVEEPVKQTVEKVAKPVNETKNEPVKAEPVAVIKKEPVNQKPEVTNPGTVEPKPIEATKEEFTSPDFKESAYVIQIGSFSNKENATNLVKKLREQDYRAYQRVSDDLSRVFVGPYPEESIAKSRSEKLAKIVGSSVKVIKFDPIKH